MGLFGTDIGPDIKIGGGDNGLLGQIGGGLEHGLRTVGSFLGLNDEGMPQFNAPTPDANLQKRLTDYQTGMGAGPEALEKKYAEGVGSQGLGFDPTNSALDARAKRAFYKNAGSLPRQASYEAQVEAAKHAQQASGMQITLDNYKRGIDQAAQNVQLQAEITRNQVLQGIFGNLGEGVGRAYANSLRAKEGAQNG